MSGCLVHVHWLWLGFSGLVSVLLLLQRKSLTPINRARAYSAAVWFVVGLSFAALVYPMYEHAWFGATLDEASARPGADATTMFISAYLVEYALAFDNLFVISLLFRKYRVPQEHQPRAVFWGLVAAMAMRLGILCGATSLARAFAWTFYVFAAVVVYSGVKALTPPADDEQRGDALERLLRGTGRLAREDHGARFWVIQNGRIALTTLAACVVYGALIEFLFALDSVAVVSVNTTTFVIVTSNLLAAIALRGWLPMLDTIQAIRCPEKAIAALLVLLGIKLLTHHHFHVPPAILLAVITGLIGAAVVESFAPSRA